MNEPFIIFGAGGHGKVALDAARAAGFSITWAIDDRTDIGELLGCPVIDTRHAEWGKLERFRFLVAVGDNVARARIVEELRAKGGRPVSVVHPSAIIAPSARLGEGTLVCSGVVVNPAAMVGEHVILNTCASVDHDCVVGDYVHLCPGVRLAGAVTVGAGTMVGLGSVVLPGLIIGEGCVVGAGSVVNRSLPSRVVAFGNPARVRRSLAVEV